MTRVPLGTGHHQGTVLAIADIADVRDDGQRSGGFRGGDGAGNRTHRDAVEVTLIRVGWLEWQ